MPIRKPKNKGSAAFSISKNRFNLTISICTLIIIITATVILIYSLHNRNTKDRQITNNSITTIENNSEKENINESKIDEKLYTYYSSLSPRKLSKNDLVGYVEYFEYINRNKYNEYNVDKILEDSEHIIDLMSSKLKYLYTYKFSVTEEIGLYPEMLINLQELQIQNKQLNVVYEVLAESIGLIKYKYSDFINARMINNNSLKLVSIKPKKVKLMRRAYVSALLMKDILVTNYKHFKNKVLVHYFLVFINLLWEDFEDLLGNKEFKYKGNQLFDWDLKKTTKYYIISEQLEFAWNLVKLICLHVINELYTEFDYTGNYVIEKEIRLLMIGLYKNKSFAEITGGFYRLISILNLHEDEIIIFCVLKTLEDIGAELTDIEL